MNRSKKKKGFTLIELVVAMGILTMVFAGTVTLIISVVNLAMSTRTKTTVVALAQKGLAESIREYRMNPAPTGNNLCSSLFDSLPLDDAPEISDISCIINPDPDPAWNFSDGYSYENFTKIEVTVKWTAKGAQTSQSYKLVQTIKRRGQ